MERNQDQTRGHDCLNQEDCQEFLSVLSKLMEMEFSHPADKDQLFTLEEKIKSALHHYGILKMACQHSADSLHITDGEGNVLFVNEVFEKASGVSSGQILHRNVRDVEREGIYSPSVVALALKERRKLTMTQRTRYSQTTLTTSTPVFDGEGNIVLVVSNARPVEELKLLHEYFQNHREKPSYEADPRLIYRSGQMERLVELLDRIASVNSAVLFTGESGTGKSLLAQYVHEHGARSKHKFVKINCAAIPETLLESELFGYESGAFTGARPGGKKGLIETADKGTLFLDEIGDMPPLLQAKLLQVIQCGEIQRIGGEEPIGVDVRIISATNKNLEQMMGEGRFRRDLFYRLNVVPIRVPSLRERTEDIGPLAEAFLLKNNDRYEKNVVLSGEVMECFYHYQWPGNIRELENLVERLVVTSCTGLVSAAELPDNFCVYFYKEDKPTVVKGPIRLQDALQEVERQLITSAYRQLGSSYKVAKRLGISQSGASRKIQKYVLEE